MTRIKLVGLVILSILAGYFLGGKFPISEPPVQNQTISTSVNSSNLVNNPLGTVINVDTPRGKLVIWFDRDRVYFSPFEGAVFNSLTIEKSKYPELFKQGIANQSAISINRRLDPMDDKLIIELSNDQPDHGGLVSTYQLDVDPTEGSIQIVNPK